MRILNKIFAFLYGFFWLPCPICDRMFGGHEIAKTSLMTNKYLGDCVCKNCNNEAIRRNKQEVYNE